MTVAPIVITGVGMRSSVGSDVVQCAAAVRAGINRFALWPDFPMRVDGEPALSAGALTPRLGDLPWTDALEALLETATREAVWAARLLPGAVERLRVGSYLATAARTRAGLEPGVLEAFAAEWEPRWLAGAFGENLCRWYPFEHAAGLLAISDACSDLRSRRCDVAIVGGFDSWLNVPALESLFDDNRLKTSLTSDGLIPGEAGAVVILELAESAARRGVPPLARMGAVVTDNEAVPLGDEHPIRADALTRVLHRLFEEEDPAQLHRAYVDLSGERWRSLEWSVAETRCLSRLPYGWKLCHPADCLGDVGAASGVAFTALSVRAFARAYAGPGSILLATASAEGQRAAAVIHPVVHPAVRSKA